MTFTLAAALLLHSSSSILYYDIIYYNINNITNVYIIYISASSHKHSEKVSSSLFHFPGNENENENDLKYHPLVNDILLRVNDYGREYDSYLIFDV